MGALAQLDPTPAISKAVTNVTQPIEKTVSQNLGQLDKDLSLSQNAPLIAAATAAYLSGGAVGGETLAGAGAAGAGATAAELAAYDAMAGLTAGGAGAAGAGLAGAGLAGAVADPYALSTAGGGLVSSAGGAFNPYTAALPAAAAGGGLGGLLSNITPAQALTGAGLAAKALGGSSSTPSSSTTSTSIDPDIKAAYLQQLADARTAAAGLGTRQFEGFTPGYATAEQQLTATGIGGAGQQTTNRAAELALAEAGYTPQQIQAMTGAQYMGAYQNPYETQVVQGTLADIERQRQIAQQAQQARAVGARAFGGSRQAVAESLANEDYLRQAANTAAQLRSAGFTTAAGLGQTDAARAMEAARANIANQIAGAGIRQTAVGQLGALGAQQQNLGMTGAQAVMTAEQQRQQLAQARLDAARNLAAERLGLTGSALGQNVPNLGGTTTTPIYRNQMASGLGGALGGAQLGSILGGTANPQYAGYGAILGGLLGLG